MRATVMYRAGDVRIENVSDATNDRQRRDAPLLDPRDGRGGSDALRAPDLRAYGRRLAPSGARPEGDTV
jgi:hypothetical protein